MGKPGAKKTDQIVSATPGDVHIIMVPSPGGPVPTPIPHPCTSIIKDGVAEKVKVMGQPGAVKGSTSKHTPPHVPMGPGPFQKPPANRGEIVTASSNVEYESKAAAMLGDTAMMCSDPSDAPVGKVMGTAATVLVGGGGGGSDADRAAAAAAAMAAAMAAAAKSQLLLAAMTGTGHPVDVGTGALVITTEDLSLASPLPIQFVRTYLSSKSRTNGPMGYGWVHNFQEQIELVDRAHEEWETINGIYAEVGNPSPSGRYLIYRDPNGVAAHYHAPERGDEVQDMIRHRRVGRDEGVFWIRDRRGKQTRFAAPTGARDGRILLPTDARDRNGNRTFFRYDTAGRLREVQDCYDRRVLLTYSADGRHVAELALQASVKHPVKRWCSYRYNDAGDLVEVVDVAGASTKFGYADHLIVEDRNRDGYSFYFVYDRERRCVKTWGQDGYLTRHLDYDTRRHRTREVNGEGETTIYHLTPQGAVKRIEKGGPGIVTDETTFDDAGRPVTRSRRGTVTMSVCYDEDGNIAELMDAEQQSTKFTYNAFGQVTSKVGPSGETEQFRYDARGNMVKRTYAGGGVTRYEHDERGRTVAERGPGGRVVLTRYDAFGNISARGDGTRETLVEADPLGNVVRIESPGLPLVTFEWNARGKLTRTTAGEYVIARAEYNAEGYRTSQLDERGVLHRYVYSAPGVVSEYSRYAAHPWERRVTPRGDRPAVRERRGPGMPAAADDGEVGLLLRIRYDRDSEGRPRTATDNLGRTRRFALDSRGEICGVTSSDTGPVEFGRDDRGLITSIHAAGGVDDRFDFDARGRVTRVRYGDELTDTYEWDDAGRLASASNPSAELAYEYDDAGRQVVRRQGEFELSAKVDEVGGTVTWTMPDGPLRQYEVDRGGRTRAITFGGRRLRVKRDAAGTILATSFPNGVTQAFTQDPYGRLAATRVTGPAVAPQSGHRLTRPELYRQDVTYRTNDGRVEYVDDSRSGRWKYGYDPKDRLVRADLIDPVAGAASAKVSEGQRADAEFYRFDDRDNVIRSHRFANARTSGDQLLVADEREYSYDARGCVAAIREGERVWRFEHDAKGQLARVRLPDGGCVAYRYDALGRRVEKAFTGGARDGRIVRFFWDVDNPVKEEHWRTDRDDSEGPALERFYLFNGFTALARIDRDEDGERSLYFHNDHTGRPQICTDDRGQVAWQWTGDSFGAGVDSGVVEQNIRMPGQYFDEETGLSYNRYRYYDPRACRYLQPDPIVRPTDVSRYAYPTDPLSRIDPLGLTAQIVVTDWRDPVLNGGYVDQGDLLNGQGYTGEFEGNASRLHFKNGGELPKYMHDAQPPDLKGVTHVIVTGHGGFEGIEIREPDGTTQIVGGEELADYLKKKGLTPENGVQVTLVACHTGAARPDGSSVARDLAQALGPGAVVHAPTDYVCVLENGDVHVLNGGTMEQFVYREPTIPTNAAPPSDEEDTHRVPTVSDSEDTRRIVAPPDDGSTQRIRAVEPAAEDDFSEDSLIEPPKQVTRAAPPGPHNDNDEDDPPIEPPPPDPVRQTQDNGSGIEDDEPTQVTKRR